MKGLINLHFNFLFDFEENRVFYSYFKIETQVLYKLSRFTSPKRVNFTYMIFCIFCVICLGKLHLSASKYNNYAAHKTEESFMLQPISPFAKGLTKFVHYNEVLSRGPFFIYFTVIGV